jgi:hypothetical protein
MHQKLTFTEAGKTPMLLASQVADSGYFARNPFEIKYLEQRAHPNSFIPQNFPARSLGWGGGT